MLAADKNMVVTPQNGVFFLRTNGQEEPIVLGSVFLGSYQVVIKLQLFELPIEK